MMKLGLQNSPSWEMPLEGSIPLLCLQGGEIPPHGGELEVRGGWNFRRARGADRGGEDRAGARGAGGWSCGAQGIRQPHGW